MQTLEVVQNEVAPVRRSGATQKIADYLGVTYEVGSLVRNYIEDVICIDSSECSQRSYNAACREAYAQLTK